MSSRPFLALLALVMAGCASVAPLQPLTGGSARQAWDDLVRMSSASETLSSYASVRVSTPEGRRTFRATIDAGRDGVVRMRAFTPVGTEVFAFEVRGDEMVFEDHGAKKSWRGPFAEVAVQLGIPESITAADFARLSFGFPAADVAADLEAVGQGLVRQGDLTYEVTGLGLGSVSKDGSSWRVEYDPATFPPEKVTFRDGERSIVVRHLDLTHSRERIEPLVPDPSYACCYRPVIAPE